MKPPKTHKLELDKIIQSIWLWKGISEEGGKGKYFYFHSYTKDLIEQYIEQQLK